LSTEITPRGRDFIHLHDNMGISKFDCSHNGVVMVKTMPPSLSGCADDCGMVDLPTVRRMATAVASQGTISAHAFSEECNEAEPESPGTYSSN
jgi:hypothetical protein